MMAYRAAGLTIPRTTYQQWRYGQHIPAGQEQPGDLVFFNPGPNGPGHVGLVIGNGRMIEAQQTGVPVKISTYRNRDPVGFTRPMIHAQSQS